MKLSKNKRLSLLSIFAVFVLMSAGYLTYQKTWDQSFMFILFWLLFIVIWVVMVNKKEKFFIDDSSWQFLNNEKAWKKAYKIWAILSLFIWIVLIVNTAIHMFSYLYMGNIFVIATLLTVLITLVYLFKYKK